jgi:hypothetical protein
MHPANKLNNVRRRVDRARAKAFPRYTCPASRHVHLMADALARGDRYAMFEEEPEHCAGALLAVLEDLWKLRVKTDWPGERVRERTRRDAEKRTALAFKRNATP